MYKMFYIAMSEAVMAARSYSSAGASVELGSKLEKTAKFVGAFFLINACLLQATETIARKALFYKLIWSVIFYISPIWLAIAAFWWRKDLANLAKDILPKSLGQRIYILCTGSWNWLFCLPISFLLFIVLIVKMAISELSQLDSAKRVSAHIFRRKIESAAKGMSSAIEKRKLYDDYLSYFELGIPSDNALLVSPSATPLRDIVNIVQHWVDNESSEHTVAIQGEKGIGKSCLLSQIKNHFQKIKVISISIPEKITEEKQLFDFLLKKLNIDFKDENINIEEKVKTKTLILIDEGQNLFLAKRNGFKAFQAFINICSIRNKNLFWCMTINRYSWAYVNAVTGGSQYFRRVFVIDAWSDSDIKTLILNRHEKTGYKLEFDPIIFAMNERKNLGKIRLVQDRYFELIWEQAKGNPRTAIILWLSALEVLNTKKIRIGIPSAVPAKPLMGLTDDELFVIAAIIRHENLTFEEAVSVTSQSEGLVQHAFMVGLERGFLESNDAGRIRICPLWQASLTQALNQKNFIYG